MTKTVLFLIVGLFGVTGIANQGRSTALAQSTESNASALVDLRVRARAAEQARQYEQVVTLYRQYLSLKPHDDEARTALALALAYNKQFAEAVVVYKDILTRYPRDLDVQLALARVYAWQKQYAEAQTLYEHVLRESPNYTDAKHGLADTLFWNGEDAAALRLYEEVYAVAPTNELAQRITLIKNRIAQPIPPVQEIAQEMRRRGNEEESRSSRDYVSIGYSHFRYSNTIPVEQTWQFTAVKHMWDRTFVGQVDSIDRFGKHDNVFSGEVYSSLWRKSWGNLAFSFSPTPKFSSRWTFGGAVYQGLGTVHPLLSRLELSCGYRHMSFVKSEVDLLSPGITIYLPYNMWLTEQGYMVPESGSRSLSSRLDWEPAERWHAFVSGSFGQSVEQPTAAQDVTEVNTLSLAGGVEFPLTQRISAEISYHYEDRAKYYRRDGGAIKLTYSW